jgi:hypothetical protein
MQHPKCFDFRFREKRLETFIFPILGTCGNVAETEKSHAHIVNLLVGVLKARFPTDFSQKLERPG